MATTREIAEIAGVSRQTVSLVLNGHGGRLRIASETSHRIFEIAEELGYCRNELASSVRRGRSRMVGVICRGRGSYVMEEIEGINAGLSAEGYSMKLFHAFSVEEISLAVRQCIEYMASGIICRGLEPEHHSPLREAVEKHRIPVCQIDYLWPVDWASSVISDDAKGGELIVQHFMKRGLTRLLCMGLHEVRQYSLIRVQAVLNAQRAAGLELFEPFLLEDENIPIEKIGERIRKDRIEGIFCVSDPLAARTILKLHEENIRIPEDCCVIGFGNLEYCKFLYPPLTSIAQPFFDMGMKSAEIILDQVERKNPMPSVVKMPVYLEERQSTAN